jgi:hypothetical protein
VPTSFPTVMPTVSLRRRAISGSSLSVGVVSSSSGSSSSGNGSVGAVASGPIVMEVKVLSSEDAYKMLRESGGCVKSIQVRTLPNKPLYFTYFYMSYCVCQLMICIVK